MSEQSYHGKQPLPLLGFDETDPDPKAIARSIFKHRQDSVIASVATHIATSVGTNAVVDDIEKLDELLDLLVDRKLISADERKTWDAGDNRIKMANKINKYHHVILDDRILPYLAPGYSVLYQLVSLYEDIVIAEEAKTMKEMADA